MPQKRPIRFYLPTAKLWITRKDEVPVPTHALVGYRYLEALLKTDIPFRILSQGMNFNLLDEDPDWAKYAHLFMDDTPLDDFINVVCGFGTVFGRVWTANTINVAITVTWPRPPNSDDVYMLKRYDYVCVPNTSDIQPITDVGLSPTLLPIHPSKLVEFYAKITEISASSL